MGGIKGSFESNGPIDIDALLDDIQEKTLSLTEKAMLESLEAACLEAVAEARAQPSPGYYPFEMRGKVEPHQPNYIDWTNNLRSSIGYILYYNGIEHKKLFMGTQEGMKAGEEAARKVASGNPNGIFACIVAGMNYALFVESKGYNVISDQAMTVKDKFEDYLKEAFKGIKGK